MSISQVFFDLAVIAAILGPVFVIWGVRRAAKRGRPLFAWGLGAICAILWALGVWSTFIEPELLVVRRVTVATPRWTGAPLTIGLIADTHVGAPHMNAQRVAKIVQRMNGEHPDLVLLLGDYVGGHQSRQRRSAKAQAEITNGLSAFAGLRAPLGVVGVLGNHDVWYDENAVRDGLAAAHATVLNNSTLSIHRQGGDFSLAGLADLEDVSPRKSAKPVVSSAQPGLPVILMAHEPDAFVVWDVPYALMVAGHTHCGQINLPILRSMVIIDRVQRRYPCHLYWKGDQALFVSGGLGVSNLPVRLRAPPEIDLITLRSDAAPAAK